MSLHLSALLERLRASLFFVPTLFVLAGGALGMAMVEVDAALDDEAANLPLIFTSTVESAREILSVVASATITVAGVAFSISLLVIQQASSQYSPRVVHSLFRDPFNRRVMGVALGTFAYALMVLRAVRSPLEEGGEAVVPNLSVAVAVVLGVTAILAIVAFIDHNAHTMEVSQILHRVTTDATAQIERTWPDQDAPREVSPARVPAGPGHPVTLQQSGWIQQVSSRRLLELVPEGGTVRLETRAGRYAIEGTVLCTIWPHPDDPGATEDDAAGAVEIGATRTMQQDPSYGLRQLADVALVALSPGVNDPTTAQDAIFHLAGVLRTLLQREQPPEVEFDDHGRQLIHGEPPTFEDLVGLAFDEIRRAAAELPAVAIYLLEALHLVEQSLPERHRSLAPVLHRQAELVVAGAARAQLLPSDLADVRRVHAERFARPAAGTAEPSSLAG